MIQLLKIYKKYKLCWKTDPGQYGPQLNNKLIQIKKTNENSPIDWVLVIMDTSHCFYYAFNLLIVISKVMGGRVGVPEGVVSRWMRFMVMYHRNELDTKETKSAICIQRYTRGYCIRLRVLFYSSVESYNVDDDVLWNAESGPSSADTNNPSPHETDNCNSMRFWNRKRFNANKIIDNVHKPVNPHTWDMNTENCGVSDVREIKTRLLDICHILHPASSRIIKRQILDDHEYYPCNSIEYDSLLRSKKRRMM